jgi:excisionase family DNA binding protein
MNFPSDFSREARDKVVAAEIRAGRFVAEPGAYSFTTRPAVIEHGPTWLVFRYIMLVFAVFASEACKLGEASDGWSLDIVDREVREFLRLLTIKAELRYGGGEYRLPPMLSNMDGSILPEIQAAFETFPEWKEYQDNLLKLADQHRSPAPPEASSTNQQGDSTKRKKRRLLVPDLSLLEKRTLLNRQEAALALGISERTLDRWIDEGKLSPQRAGHRISFKVVDLKQLLEK